MGEYQKLPQKQIPVDIKLGVSDLPLACEACTKFEKMGFFIVLSTRTFLICIKCVSAGIVRMQEAYPDLKMFETVVKTDYEDYVKAAKAVQSICPELTDTKALEVAKVAIDAI